MFRLGIVQITPGQLDKVLRLVRNSSPDLLLLPEYTLFDPTGLKPEEIWQRAISLEEFVGDISKIAKKTGSYVAGGFLERGDKPKVYNTTTLVSPDGDLVGIYRKTHLFDAYGYRESDFVTSGEKLSDVYDIRGTKIAFSVCFELRFPEIFRELALKGAHLVAVPAAWYSGPLKEETLHILSRARAIENGIYVAVSALYGPRFTGRSIVVNPMGVVELDLGVGERYGEASIDLTLLEEARRAVPSLHLRKPQLYEKICGGLRQK
ncbi:MAG: carbon-nitrogen hydrolase family protein [Pyrobaculum sp.]